MSFKVTTRTFFTKNSLPALIKRLKLQESDASVTIGIHQAEGEREKKSNDGSPARLLLIDVATFMEFGTANVPQRSFIRGNDAQNFRKYKKLIEQLKDKVIFDGWTHERAMKVLGEVILRDIRERIRNGIAPELQPSTIKKKGSSIPLIDTGQLINGLTYVVRGVK